MTKKATKTGKELEQRVAGTYRKMGARKVEHDVRLAGNQIDVYVELGTADRSLHRIAVEAKDWTSKVGIDVVNDFALRVRLLRDKGKIDRGVIVSTSGFSKEARDAAKEYDIRLLELADLGAMVVEAKAEREKVATAPTPPVSPADDVTAVEERAFLKQNIEQCLAPLAEESLAAQTLPPTPQPGEGEQLPLAEIVTPSGQRILGWLVKILQDPLLVSIVTVLALAVAIGTWFWPDIRTLLFPTTPAPTPTPTVMATNLMDARVRFTITLSKGDKLKVPAGGTLTLTPGDGVLIETSITVGPSPFPRDLTYQYFAPVGSIPEELVGPTTSYIAPDQPGPDFITLLITDPETGSEILRSINVIVKEKSP